MSTTRVYLDHNATAPLRPQARTAMRTAMDVLGNPSSVHADGRAARAIVETARESVAALVGARPHEVVFTSGASEANAWILSGRWDTILASPLEHDSILATLRATRSRHVVLAARPDGRVAHETLADLLAADDRLGRAVLTVQLANNETGVVQPVAELAEIARARGIAVHTDAVQAAGRILCDMAGLGVDALSLSAHKIGGPTGIGALIVRDGLALPPLIPGGQERRRRGGTENVIGIAGFGAAAAAAASTREDWRQVAARRDRIEAAVHDALPGTVVVARTASRLPNTSLLAHPELRAETAVIRLDLAGLSVSAGAACSSGKVGQSHVLSAMGLESGLARSAVRVSLGLETTDDDISTFLAAWRDLRPRTASGHAWKAAG